MMASSPASSFDEDFVNRSLSFRKNDIDGAFQSRITLT
ncbi:hypothetical protein roselon_00147 [Roseibacterium elongatum DSM 19469]|uniref:Uncharacterized protein n=1 Tax=Roseicyclus elongatus DSM 19469 TaxID=1294273 RepID=W8RN95_9RHOB|nr:hypothetical protein roselon_00147 [Roseibacterium elongatum DSM 19469]